MLKRYPATIFCALLLCGTIMVVAAVKSYASNEQPPGPVPGFVVDAGVEDTAKADTKTLADKTKVDGVKDVIADADKADPSDVVSDVISDLSDRNWREGAGGIVFLLMIALGKFRDKLGPFKGDRGLALATLAMGLLGGTAFGLLSKMTLSPMLMVGSLIAGIFASGLYSTLGSILWPKDNPDGHWLPGLKKLVKPKAKDEAPK